MSPLILLILLSFLSLLTSPASAGVVSLIEAERAFSRATVEKGIKEGFLAYLAEDSILFRPGPVAGRQWIMERPSPPGLLSWEPSHAEISGAGDLGFTTGPFEIRERAGGEPSGFGQFFSVWKKQPDGSWKVVLDAGINHERPQNEIKLTSRSVDRATLPEAERAAEENFLASTDQSVASMSREIMAEDVITLRNLHYPKRGIDLKEKAALANCNFQRQALHMSASADLAYVYGTYKCPDESGVYVRVWRKEEVWQIALDYRAEVPPAARRHGPERRMLISFLSCRRAAGGTTCNNCCECLDRCGSRLQLLLS